MAGRGNTVDLRNRGASLAVGAVESPKPVASRPTDYVLQIKLVESLKAFDEFLSAVERINRHNPRTGRYLFRVIEVADEMLVELRRMKVRLWEGGSYGTWNKDGTWNDGPTRHD